MSRLTRTWRYISNFATVFTMLQFFLWIGSILATGGLSTFFAIIRGLPLYYLIPIWIGIIIFWGIIFWLVATYGNKHRAKILKNKALIAAKIPYLAELTDTLAKIYEQTTLVSKSLESRKVPQHIIEKCNDEYVRLAKSGYIEKPLNFTENLDVETTNRLIKKVWEKLKSPLDSRVLATMGQLSEIMERHRIGLRPHLDKDEAYKTLDNKLTEQRAKVNKKTANLISIYLDFSYNISNLALLYVYVSNTILKDIKDKPPYLNRPISSIRTDMDTFMFGLLAEIQEEIERSVSEDN